MRFVIFTHSLISDWNHGNAHFLRGIATELVERGHDVRLFEPRDGWSLRNLIAENGQSAVAGFEQAYPKIRSVFYDLEALDVDKHSIAATFCNHEELPRSLQLKYGVAQLQGLCGRIFRSSGCP